MKLRCIVPFTYLEIGPRGEVYCCCPIWTKVGPIGNIKESSIAKIWNSRKAQMIRKRVYEGNLEAICNQEYCPFYIARHERTTKEWLKAKPELKPIIKELENKKTVFSRGPAIVEISDSGECNLRCKMCVSNEEFIPPDRELARKIFEEVLPRLLPDIRYLTFSGNGEPLYRKETREFLRNFNPQKFPHLKFNLLSNGLLLNQKMWDSIGHNRFNSINISVDAVTKETYEKIRIGGNWEKLQKNLKMLSRLRKEEQFGRFRINMVVMKSNYQEMRQFVQLGKKLKCDEVLFSKIFGHYSLGGLEENINWFPDPKIFLKIKEILKDPIFADPIVNIVELESYKNYRLTKEERTKKRWAKIKKIFLTPLYQIYFRIPTKYRFLQYIKRLGRRR